MIHEGIERRRDPRTQAYLPITLHFEGVDEAAPAHLLDLSSGGAAVLTTAYDAPYIGQYLDLLFETLPNGDDDSPGIRRRETGIVVHLHDAEQGVSRLGIRFIQHRGIESDLFDPIEVLSDHRRYQPLKPSSNRWATARNFERLKPPAPALN